MLVSTLVAALGLLSGASAAAIGRQTCAYECGTVCYYQRTIDSAVAAGVKRLRNPVSGYPHQYNNREGFEFDTPGPWYEYPIMHSYKVYNGGPPGADRVIFNGQGQFEAVITHTGETNNNFGECEA